MVEVISKVDETIEIIDNSEIVKKLKELKDIMNNDTHIKKLLDDFDILKKKYQGDDIVTDELVVAKRNLYKHPIISEYRCLFSDLNHSFLIFNNKITSLLKEKNSTCSRN